MSPSPSMPYYNFSRVVSLLYFFGGPSENCSGGLGIIFCNTWPTEPDHSMWTQLFSAPWSQLYWGTLVSPPAMFRSLQGSPIMLGNHVVWDSAFDLVPDLSGFLTQVAYYNPPLKIENQASFLEILIKLTGVKSASAALRSSPRCSKVWLELLSLIINKSLQLYQIVWNFFQESLSIYTFTNISESSDFSLFFRFVWF